MNIQHLIQWVREQESAARCLAETAERNAELYRHLESTYRIVGDKAARVASADAESAIREACDLAGQYIEEMDRAAKINPADTRVRFGENEAGHED